MCEMLFRPKIVITTTYLFNETFSDVFECKSLCNFWTDAEACFNPNSIAAVLFLSSSSWSEWTLSQSKSKTKQTSTSTLALPWNRWRTESGIESKSSGTSKKLPNTESKDPLFGAWQTGHSLEFTKQLWQEKCPQFVNEPGTLSPPGPQTRCPQI